MGTVHRLRHANWSPREILEAAMEEDLESIVILKRETDGSLTASWSATDSSTLCLFSRLFEMKLDQHLIDEADGE